MHCAICDREDENIQYNKQTKEFDPCGVCQAVIDDCIAGYEPLESSDVE